MRVFYCYYDAMTPIKLFVGLGNPGGQYEATRHNAGFWWVDLVAASNNSPLKLDSKFLGLVGKLSNSNDTWLLKPNTFMNASGKAVAALANYYKILPEQILVIHDELDLPAGTVKLKKAGGHGGHNGLKDIAATMGTPDFWRLRLGIGHPGDRNEVVNFVLKAPTKDEQSALDGAIDKSLSILPQLLSGDFEQAMLKLHSK